MSNGEMVMCRTCLTPTSARVADIVENGFRCPRCRLRADIAMHEAASVKWRRQEMLRANIYPITMGMLLLAMLILALIK
jgi:hypothetical protein